MAETTAIAWCDHTRNFWEGCAEVSPGCDACYAKARDLRFHRGAHWGPNAPRLPHLESAARDLRRWNRQAAAAGVRRRVFINSLSDFFDNAAPQEWRDVAIAVMAQCPALDFLILTKRIGNAGPMWPLPYYLLDNVWLGATVVNQEEADRDLPKLLRTPAAIRFVSYEPALGPVVFDRFLRYHPNIPAVDWIIVGGESAQVGHQPRIFPVSWARHVIEQCHGTGTKVFVKQLGSNPLIGALDGFTKDAIAGGKWDEPARWPDWLRVQEFPA